MSRKNFTLDLLSFASQSWLLEPQAHNLLLAQLMQQGNVTLAMEEDDPIHYASPDWTWYPAAQVEGSTVVLRVTGVIYDYYAEYLCSKLDLIYQDPKLSGMVVQIKSPGGAANAAYKIADKIAQSPIPTTALVDYGMAASSGYLIGCACDQFWASRPNDLVGSIGTYIPYQNWDGYYKKLGIEQEDIYAEQSSEKNQEGRQAAKGNFDLLQKMSNDEAARFISYVKARRPDIDIKAGDPFKGKIFSANDALSIGLIDGIGDLKAAVKALKSSDTIQNTTPRTTMSKLFGYVKATALMALVGEASAVTDQTLEAANQELSGLGITGAQLVSQAEFDSMVEAANKAPDTTAKDTEITNLKNQITTLTTERNTAQSEVTRLGALNGAEKTNIQSQGDKPVDEGQNSADDLIANLPHNKSLEGTWLGNLGVTSEAK